MVTNLSNTVTIYIQLLDEGSYSARPTQAIDIGNGFFKVLSTPAYDPADEVWEFPPGSIVRCEMTAFHDGDYLLAVEKAD
jgi:hypothetical protein